MFKAKNFVHAVLQKVLTQTITNCFCHANFLENNVSNNKFDFYIEDRMMLSECCIQGLKDSFVTYHVVIF